MGQHRPPAAKHQDQVERRVARLVGQRVHQLVRQPPGGDSENGQRDHQNQRAGQGDGRGRRSFGPGRDSARRATATCGHPDEAVNEQPTAFAHLVGSHLVVDQSGTGVGARRDERAEESEEDEDRACHRCGPPRDPHRAQGA